MAKISANPAKEKLYNLLTKKKYQETSDLAQDLAQKHPDDPDYKMYRALALMALKEYRKANKVLRKTAQAFPGSWEIHNLLGQTYGHLGQWKFAAEAFEEAIEIIPEEITGDMSFLYNCLGDARWEEGRREDAIDAWKKAVEIDPGNDEARQSLDECTNEFGEPKAPSPLFDDMYHFKNIQLERYYALAGSRSMSGGEEAKRVLAIIMNGWNEHCSPRSREIDEMTTQQKTEFFKSIELDFGIT